MIILLLITKTSKFSGTKILAKIKASIQKLSGTL